MNREKVTILVLSVLTGTFLSLYAQASRTSQPLIIEPAENAIYETVLAPDAISEPAAIVRDIEETPEEWHETDRKLSGYEWDIMGQVIMAEARGESFETQYHIACTILNRVESELFPDTIAGVIYQTKPVQFCGAWDTEWYEVSDSVWEAIQEALIENTLPEDVLYFTSEGWLPGTEAWERVGNMWFSRQR